VRRYGVLGDGVGEEDEDEEFDPEAGGEEDAGGDRASGGEGAGEEGGGEDGGVEEALFHLLLHRDAPKEHRILKIKPNLLHIVLRENYQNCQKS